LKRPKELGQRAWSMCKNWGRWGDFCLSTTADDAGPVFCVNHSKVQFCKMDLETSCLEPLDL